MTPSDLATVTKVDEVRTSNGLEPLGPPDGELTLSEYKAKNAPEIAAAAAADDGEAKPEDEPTE